MWTLTDNKDWAALEAQFSWVNDMQHVPQDPVHHAEGNVAIHTRMVLEALQQQEAWQTLSPQEREILWASALLHDVEKRSTTETGPDGSISAHGHARKGAATARQLLYREHPTPFAIREMIYGLVRHHSLPLWLLERRDPLKELVSASLEVNTQWLALLARADVIGRICHDKADLLYRIDCFEEFCKEHDSWGTERPFAGNYARFHYLHHPNTHVDYVPYEQPVIEVVLMSGLPGAGKDTFVKKHYRDWPVISLDDIRESQGIHTADKSGNGQVVQAAKEKAREYLRRQQRFVWNATNTTRQMRAQLISLFLQYKAAVKIIYVEAPYKQLLAQNKSREAVVPANIMDKLARKLEVPARWEAHEVIYHPSY